MCVCVCVSAGVGVLLRSRTVYALQPTLQSHDAGTLQRPPESDTATAADRYKHTHFLSDWALPAGFVIGVLGDGAVSLYEIRTHSHSEPVSFPSPHSSTLTSDLHCSAGGFLLPDIEKIFIKHSTNQSG